MACLRRKPNSRFWIGCYTDHTGRQRQRSTGTVDRSEAMRIALAYEDAHRRRMTEDQVRRVLSDVCESINGRRLSAAKVSDYFARWLMRKEAEVSTRTAQRYREAVKWFEAYLGTERWEQDLTRLGVRDFAGLRDDLVEKVSVGTANLVLKVLAAVMKSAWAEGLTPDNPVAKVTRLRTTARTKRRPFTIPELKLLVEHATSEWKGIILCGIYTGQRLGDIVRLTWRNVDLVKGEVRLITQKTGRTVIIPLARPLASYFLGLPSVDDVGAPVFPQAFAVVEREGRVSSLSNEFYEIQVAAGLAEARATAKQKEGNGRNVRRQQNKLVFHSLRHTATSLLKNAGVSEIVAMDIVGHDSKAVSQNYTHVDEAAKRRAMAKVPDIFAGKERVKEQKGKV